MLATPTLYYGQPVDWQAPINHGLIGWWLNLPMWMQGSRVTDLVGRHHGEQIGMGNPTYLTGSGGPAVRAAGANGASMAPMIPSTVRTPIMACRQPPRAPCAVGSISLPRRSTAVSGLRAMLSAPIGPSS